MRFAFLLFLLALPLLAQGEDEPASKPAREQLLRWIEQLHDATPTARKEAEAALRELDADTWIRLARELRSDLFKRFRLEERAGPAGLQIVLAGPSGHELIEGSATDGDQTVRYKLQSLGKGRYKLTGERSKGEGAKSEPLRDEGTMAELQKRHDFLKGTMAFRMPKTDMGGDGNFDLFVVAPNPTRVEALGITVRRPSPALAYHLVLGPRVGFLIDRVEKGSRAEKLGLKQFDVLVKLDDQWLDEPKQLEARAGVLEYVRRAKPGRLKLD